jgi:uncharacterized paraquat-inducible protein A
MTRVVARLILTALLAPLALLMLLGTVFSAQVLNVSWDRRDVYIAVVLIACAYILLSLLALIWAGSVRWTAAKRRATFWTAFAIATLAAVFTAVAVYLGGTSEEYYFLTFVGHALLALLGAAAIPILWRETRAQRLERLTAVSARATRCPACKYDLAGQTTLTCPECGVTLTLKTIVEENARRSGVDAFD